MTVSVLFCTFAAAAAAPPLASPASVWSRAYNHPQPGITEKDRERGRERGREEEEDEVESRERAREDGGKKRQERQPPHHLHLEGEKKV